MDIKRRVSGRVSPRSGAIVYGIEGSKVVLATLERTKIEDDIAFLKLVADNATAILCTLREVREGEVDDEFASLALDACGLTFVLIHECYRFRRDRSQIPDRLRWGSDELAEYLRDDIHPFVQKKINRGFLRKHLLHATDDEKIVKFREKLRSWVGKLGIQTELSIHEKVEEIISERLSRNEEVHSRIANINVQAPHPTEALRSSATDSEASLPGGDGRSLQMEKPMPQIIVSGSEDDERGKTGPTEGQALDSSYNKSGLSGPSFSPPEDLDRKQKKREAERMARKAERERWRRSAQEFSQLPLQEPAESQSRPASVTSFRSQAYSLESVQLGSISKYDEGNASDRDLALRLQAQLAKEIEEEDERKALAIGIALYNQWEAEEQVEPQVQTQTSSNPNRRQ